MSRRLTLAPYALVAALALASQGCGTTIYYQFPGPGQNVYRVEASGKDFGPKGDVAFVHPAIIEHALRQPETNIPAYTRTALNKAYNPKAGTGGIFGPQPGQTPADYRKHIETLASFDRGVVLTKEQRAALAAVQSGRFTEAQVIAAAQGLTNCIAREVSYGVSLSLSLEGFAMVGWGWKVEDDFLDTKLAGNAFHVTVNKDAKIVTVHSSPAHSTLTTPPQVANISFEKVPDKIAYREVGEGWSDEYWEFDETVADMPAGPTRDAAIAKKWNEWWGGPRAWTPAYEAQLKRMDVK